MHSNTSSQAPLHESSPRRLPDIPALPLLLFAIGVPSAAALAFARTFSQNPWQWLCHWAYPEELAPLLASFIQCQ